MFFGIYATMGQRWQIGVVNGDSGVVEKDLFSPDVIPVEA